MFQDVITQPAAGRSTLHALMVDRGLPLRGGELKRLRKAKRNTQQAVADGIGVSVRAYQRWEGGHRAEPDHIAALAEFLEVDQAALIHPDFVPRAPIMTAETRLASIQEQLLHLTGAVGEVALGVQALLRRGEATTVSSGAGSRRTAAGDSRAG